MAQRPWVSPAEVKAYTEYPSVAERDILKLSVDIARAEQYVTSYTNNTFKEYEEIPASVKTAVILIAEAYAYNTALTKREKKSETFDDYSYTAADSEAIDIDSLDLAPLLEAYSVAKSTNNTIMRMRKL